MKAQTTVTITKIEDFLSFASPYIDSEDKEMKIKRNIMDVVQEFDKVHKEYQKDVENLRIDNCFVSKEGYIVRDPQGRYVYTPAQQKLFNAQLAELQCKEYTMIASFCRKEDIPKNASEEMLKAFKGLIIE